jgi:prefoldin subunit 5
VSDRKAIEALQHELARLDAQIAVLSRLQARSEEAERDLARAKAKRAKTADALAALRHA